MWLWLALGCAGGVVLAIVGVAAARFLRMIGRGPGDWFG